ncbi:MAG: beta-galactosidase [Dinoroseobacter sp.]|jgi:beta-galactosidase
MKPSLGSCYYPEHWPQSQWASDAQRMIDAGLSIVRIGEFAWSRLEPQPGQLQWQWLDQAIEVLGSAGLQVVLGTPTATPPRWMLDKHPDMLASDYTGHPRNFGSRRHYCFSHSAYRQESVRIAELMAQRYAKSEYVIAWQIDNEYGCHDTVVSYSPAALIEFRAWLAQRYVSIEALNDAWGNVFWSMEYAGFDQIDLPNLTVTEPNPSHVMDFRRFSSDQVVVYNRAQVDVIRKHCDKPLIHNYMGRIVDFDHFRVGDDLEIASWDSYPLGFLEDRCDTDEAWKMHFYQQGDPDFQAFHHDLYRSVGKGRWWVMEQQPGPVNWAPNNPAPLAGMVRLWTWEAIAHQAEAVCYFRWRQAPFAQEQMHAGLLRPDSEESISFKEIKQVGEELHAIGEITPGQSKVAMIFDYESCWAWQTQPQGKDFDYFSLALDFYRSLRRLGLSVDILPANTQQLNDYQLLLIPGLMHWGDTLLSQLESFEGIALIGPRTGSKTVNLSIPDGLPPGIPELDCKVAQVESLRSGAVRALAQGGGVQRWFEHLETTEAVLEVTASGEPLLVGCSSLKYLAGWPTPDAMQRIVRNICNTLGIPVTELPEGLRLRSTASHKFVFNYNPHAVEFEGETITAAGVLWSEI